MTSLDFKKWNTILGWIVFFIALITFSLTVEPTASYWDCTEYIATSSKLQVGHPPGAPFYQMMGAIFGAFASEPEQVAVMVNYLSVFSSAFTILFMFWSITNLVRKASLLNKNGATDEVEFTIGKQIAVLGSGLVGSLAFTFSDSFWFSAVEAEVYAMAICLMSVLFWMALRWADEMHKPRGDRWLILISLFIGLSFGVHLMGLLTIPALGMIYYFKNYKEVTVQSFIFANVISIVVLFFVFKFIPPTTLSVFWKMEVFFVNTFGMPFNSGYIIAGLLFIAGFYFALNYTKKHNYRLLNTITLCLAFILMGFSTWIMIPIRANSDIVVNENQPSNAHLLLAYYNLEQYPENHVLYGPMYTDIYGGLDAEEPYIDDKPRYEKDEALLDKYVIVNQWKGAKQNSDSNHRGFLPRMWSSEHAVNYMEYTGLLDFTIKPEYRSNPEVVKAIGAFKQKAENGEIYAEDFEQYIKKIREYIDVKPPSFGDNLYFMLNYQMGYMYWRYFMWNFVGRQDDIQGKLDNHGNWISGIKFFDEIHLGASQDNLPSDVIENKARNTYYFLPLILGIFGFVFLIKHAPKQFWILLVFFLFTGLALKVFLRERPFEPRERDYALVGSFYVFAIWIGYGVYALFDTIKSYVSGKIAATAITIVALLAVPLLMATQNWDDHDRSNRYMAQTTAKAYLNSMEKDVGAMVFTIGDNDSFPLWFAQSVEGYRTDVRTINTSLLGTDWYIDQMKKKAFDSEAVPSEMTHKQYRHGTRNYIRYERHPAVPDSTVWELDRFMDWVLSDRKETKYGYLLDEVYDVKENIPASQRDLIYYPVTKIRVPVNKENAAKYVNPEDRHLMVDYIDIELPKSAIYKNNLMMLDILNQNDWKRPIYFTGGSFDKAEYIWMKDFLQLDGLVYKLVPIETKIPNQYDMGRVNTEVMYENVMKWDWGNSDSGDIYHDPQTRRQSISYRTNLAKLVEQLVKEGKNEKAETIIDLTLEKMPIKYFGYYIFTEPFIDGYFKIGKTDKAIAVYNEIKAKYIEYLEYYKDVPLSQQSNELEEIYEYLEKYKSLIELLDVNDQKELLEKETMLFQGYVEQFKHLFGGLEE